MVFASPLLETSGGAAVLDLGNPAHLTAWVQATAELDPSVTVGSSAYSEIKTPYSLHGNPTTYDMRLRPLRVSFQRGAFFSGAKVFLGYVEEGKKVYAGRIPFGLESIHGFIRKIGGYHIVMGFDDEATHVRFYDEVLRKRLFPPEASALSYNLYPDPVYVQSFLEVDEQREYLQLLPPVVFQTVLHLFGDDLSRLPLPPSAQSNERESMALWIPSDKAELESRSDHHHRTLGGGTSYYFRGIPGASEVIGYRDSEGRYFRLDPKRKPETPSFASHSAILRRQIDPYGIYGIDQRSLVEQLMTAETVVSKAVEEFVDRIPTRQFLPEGTELTDCATDRLDKIRTGLSAKEDRTSFQDLLLKVQVGIEPWLSISPNEPKVRFLRFVWVNNGAVGRNIFAVDENLLHAQILALIYSSDLLSNYFYSWVPADNPLRNKFRGGILSLHYNDAGELEDVNIVDGRMSTRLWNETQEGGPIHMSADEDSTLIREIKSNFSSP